ncbi:hypothetical protein [uncultured Luteimonas sp.]|uniref:hypothetical protein n=1 Tax=uncultured Luteimonas sp. TaxID=453144 RepID=UPI0026346D80|nr:hypothetical protein [uncultured Luteimonas sp.]
MDLQADNAAAPLLAAAELRTGDVLLMRGDGPLSELIAWASDSLYSHAAIVADAGDLIEASSSGVRRYPVAARLDNKVKYHFVDALRWAGPTGSPLDKADIADVLAKAVSLLGTPYPIDQLALFGAIMAVRGKWPEHRLGRLLARVALDHALPDKTGSVVCSELVYRAYAQCAAAPQGRLAPVIVVGERATAPFPDIDWKALFDEIWPLLQPSGRERLQAPRMRLNALRGDQLPMLQSEAGGVPEISDQELESARRAVLGQTGLHAEAETDVVALHGGRPGTVVPDPNPRLVSPQDLAISPSMRLLGRLMQRDDAPA